ncbi:MAG: hypothetical protein M1814_000720 [Vezdaea aestivalis]|nr:MAG: hypothetical protein M1814_000720 [Vezdaea aestivalis]
MISLLIPSRPLLTSPTQLTPTQYAFTIPTTPPFSHIAVFLLPNDPLPPNAAVAIYLKLPSSDTFTFLGALANEKPSALFRVSGGGGGAAGKGGEDAVMVDEVGAGEGGDGWVGGTMGGAEMTVGVGIEDAESVRVQLERLIGEREERKRRAGEGSGMELVRRGVGPAGTKGLAQKIIGNAFNYLASFTTVVGGQEVVPLKSFRDWWTKFEKKIELDPSFLDKGDG